MYCISAYICAYMRYINNTCTYLQMCVWGVCVCPRISCVCVCVVGNVRAFAFCATAKVSFPFSAHLKIPLGNPLSYAPLHFPSPSWPCIAVVTPPKSGKYNKIIWHKQRQMSTISVSCNRSRRAIIMVGVVAWEVSVASPRECFQLQNHLHFAKPKLISFWGLA